MTVSRATVRHFATNYWSITGFPNEPNMTEIAEACAEAFDRDDWLDDSEHWVWDIAHDIHTAWEDKSCL